MGKHEKKFIWASQKSTKDCVRIKCPEYNTYDDFNRDPSGFYVLIKVDFEYYRIEVAVCNKDHLIVATFFGRGSQDLYYTILKHEKKNKLDWFQEKLHLAYLGKELKKAEIALVSGNSAYFQE